MALDTQLQASAGLLRARKSVRESRRLALVAIVVLAADLL
jgi:hypothetical protein